MRTLTIIRSFVLGSLCMIASSCAIGEVRSTDGEIAASRADESPASGEAPLAGEPADPADGAETASCTVVCGTHCCKAPANFCGKNNACCDGVHCTVNCPCF